jgi:HEAT repeat protein
MDPITTVVVPWLGEWITVSLAGSLLSGVSQKLNPKDLEKALKVAFQASQMQADQLFYSCKPDGPQGVKKFLEGFFMTGVGREELQKPLTQELKPDVAVLTEAFQQQAEQHREMRNCRFKYLRPWLDAFTESYFSQTSTFIRYRAKLREYLERLKTSCEDVKFVGIDVSAREDNRAARLLDIFVVPNVSEEATKSVSSPERLLLERPEQLTERQAELWLEQRDRHSQERGRSMSAHEMLGSTRRRVVLLGDPGTGKTTLMRYLAVKAAGAESADIGLPEGQERLPILVYMRDWAKHPERSLLDQVRDFAENTLQVDLPLGFLEHWTEGQALLLLDGLDEVAEDATRAALVEKINCFLTAHENNWAVITSRPWGYRRDYFRTDTYPHFELELFTDEQVQEFIEHWYENRCDNAAQAQEMIRDLQDALKSKDRLQNLVKNPLLLTMVALIHRYQDTLPKRRHKLYDRAVDTLLKSWDRKGKGETYGEFKHLNRDDDLRRVMSQLAYWIHTQYETQTTESGTLIEEEELLTQLSRIIRQEYPQVKLSHAKGEAKRFVAFIRDRAGLLNEYGRGRYAFVHKTFQEYLTAEAILDKAEYEDNSELIYEAIQTYLHNSHWREVILLIVSQLKGNKAAKAIEVILRRNSPYEKWLHRDLLFAGRCLTEDPEKLAMAYPEVVSEILQQLIALETKEEESIGTTVKQVTFEILSWLKETAFEIEALENLKSAKKSIDQWRFLDLQATLGEKEIVLITLHHLLESPDSDIHCYAAITLMSFNDRSEAAVNHLLLLLQDSNSYVRNNAADALVQWGDLSEAVSHLLKLLQDPNSDVRSNAAWILYELDNRSEAVVNEVFQLLQDSHSWVRYYAVKTLLNWGDYSDAVVSSLFKLLQDPDLDVRSDAEDFLEDLEYPPETLINGLLELLQNFDSNVRCIAASALGTLGYHSEAVVNGLLQLLKDSNPNVRSYAAWALGELDDCSDTVIDGLLHLIQDSDLDARYRAAWALGKLGHRSVVVVNSLFQILQDSVSDVNLKAALALVDWGYCSEAVINGLLQLLLSPDSRVRYNAALALGELDNRSASILDGFLLLLQDSESAARSIAAELLGNFGDHSVLVISRLLSLLKDEDQHVRSSAANALSNLGQSDSEIQAVLAQWIEQHSDLPNLGSAIDALWQICA